MTENPRTKRWWVCPRANSIAPECFTAGPARNQKSRQIRGRGQKVVFTVGGGRDGRHKYSHNVVERNSSRAGRGASHQCEIFAIRFSEVCRFLLKIFWMPEPHPLDLCLTIQSDQRRIVCGQICSVEPIR